MSYLAPMTWLGWGPFEKDPGCFDEEVLEGQDFWVGTGRVLIAGVYNPGVTSRSVRTTFHLFYTADL